MITELDIELHDNGMGADPHPYDVCDLEEAAGQEQVNPDKETDVGVSCKFCHQNGLEWHIHDTGKYRLFDIETGDLHSCLLKRPLLEVDTTKQDLTKFKYSKNYHTMRNKIKTCVDNSEESTTLTLDECVELRNFIAEIMKPK